MVGGKQAPLHPAGAVNGRRIVVDANIAFRALSRDRNDLIAMLRPAGRLADSKQDSEAAPVALHACVGAAEWTLLHRVIESLRPLVFE